MEKERNIIFMRDSFLLVDKVKENGYSLLRKWISILFFAVLPCSLFATNRNLDICLDEVCSSIEQSMYKNATIAVLEYSAENQSLGDYIRDYICSTITENGRLKLVTRQHTDLVFKELNYQLSGVVSDETALSICKQLGASALVFGQIVEFDNNYRLQVKVIDVETGSYILFKNYDVEHSQKIERLLGNVKAFYTYSLGLDFEGNMYCLNGIAPAAGIYFDYGLTKKISLGTKINFTYDVISKEVLSILTIDPMVYTRMFLTSPSGEPLTGVFLELQGGMAVTTFESNIVPSFACAFASGFRFAAKKFFFEPVIRIGYPFAMGIGFSTGVRF